MIVPRSLGTQVAIFTRCYNGRLNKNAIRIESAMTDDEVRAEIAHQIREAFALLATKLRDKAKEHGPVIAKTLNETAEEIDRLSRN